MTFVSDGKKGLNGPKSEMIFSLVDLALCLSPGFISSAIKPGPESRLGKARISIQSVT